jgi:Nucleotide modification associated domain 2
MNRLFSYVIPYDSGAAPNPYGGICTLVICKPVIRRIAKINDWIVATGSSQSGNANKVVYAMEVTQKMTMQEYDEYCKTKLSIKIPSKHTENYEQKVGDCIYDFSTGKIRASVHDEGNRGTDLGGMFALLSNNFYYFGETPEQLPSNLLCIVKEGQGHKSNSNEPHFEKFINWIGLFKNNKNKVLSDPILKKRVLNIANEKECALCHKMTHHNDEEIGDEENQSH